MKINDGWIAGAEVVPLLPKEVHIMADGPYIISYNEDVNSVGNNVNHAVLNNDSIAKKV